MSRTNKGSKPPGYEYNGARPGNRGCGGHCSPHGHNWAKRAAHKAERRQGRRDAAEGGR